MSLSHQNHIFMGRSYKQCLPKIAQKVKHSAKLEQFAISRWSISNRRKQLCDVRSCDTKSSFALKEKKTYESHYIILY